MKSTFGRSLLSIAVIGSCFGSVPLLAASVSAQVNGPGMSPSSSFDTVLNLPGDEAVITGADNESIGEVAGQTTQLNVADNGAVGNMFTAGLGSEVNISGGAIGNFLTTAAGSEVNVSGGVVGFTFTIDSGSQLNVSGGNMGTGGEVSGELNITGGSVGNSLVACSGGVLNISGGSVGDFLFAEPDSEINISGGTVGSGNSAGVMFVAFGDSQVNISGGTIASFFSAEANSSVNITGTEFFVDGNPMVNLQVGQPFVVADRGVTLTGVLADGEPFSFNLMSTFSPTDFFSPAATLTVTLDGPVVLGDLNLDGIVNFLDISPFIQVLTSGDFQAEGDIDKSGTVDFLDISGFIGLLSS